MAPVCITFLLLLGTLLLRSKTPYLALQVASCSPVQPLSLFPRVHAHQDRQPDSHSSSSTPSHGPPPHPLGLKPGYLPIFLFDCTDFSMEKSDSHTPRSDPLSITLPVLKNGLLRFPKDCHIPLAQFNTLQDCQNPLAKLILCTFPDKLFKNKTNLHFHYIPDNHIKSQTHNASPL